MFFSSGKSGGNHVFSSEKTLEETMFFSSGKPGGNHVFLFGKI